MHDARARLAGWMNACDRPASQRAHGWLAGWRTSYVIFSCMHERPGSRARVLKVGWKSPKMQSFGIKIERIDRDLLCIYETNAKWASVHICSVKWAEAKGDLDLRFKVVLWSTLT